MYINVKKKGENMPDTCFGKEEKEKVENFLKGYRTGAMFVRMDRYEKEYFSRSERFEDDDMLTYGVPLAKAEMFEVRHFILGLDNCEEKLFLYYRYVKKLSVEKCGELLGVSRRTAYRMLDRALRLAYDRGVGLLF